MAVPGFAATQVAIGLLRGWAVVYLSTRLGLQWMGNVFTHLLRLPLDFFEKRHLGDITSRMGAVQAIQKTLSTGFVEAIIEIARRFDPAFDAATVERRPSAAGKYLGLTVTVTATSREQLDELYRTLSTHPLVKYTL